MALRTPGLPVFLSSVIPSSCFPVFLSFCLPSSRHPVILSSCLPVFLSFCLPVFLSSCLATATLTVIVLHVGDEEDVHRNQERSHLKQDVWGEGWGEIRRWMRWITNINLLGFSTPELGSTFTGFEAHITIVWFSREFCKDP